MHCKILYIFSFNSLIIQNNITTPVSTMSRSGPSADFYCESHAGSSAVVFVLTVKIHVETKIRED